MNEEKSMVEYKEQKGIFQWLKSKFETLKERFSRKEEVKSRADEGPGFTAEQLEAAEGGYPNPSVLDFEEREAKINNLKEQKSWELTEEEKRIANSPIEKGEELLEEDLESLIAGQPIMEDDEYSK